MVDSSKVATSFMLYQLIEGEILIIDIDSRIFAETEIGQPSVTQEALGIVYFLKKNEHMVRCHPKKPFLFTGI